LHEAVTIYLAQGMLLLGDMTRMETEGVRGSSPVLDLHHMLTRNSS